MGGIQRNWFGIGNTTLYGEWGSVDYGAVSGVNANTTRDGDYWGLGMTQTLDAAATDLYLGWRQYSIDARSSTSTGVDRGAEANMVMGGAIIRF
jgi:hypothetical protein